MARNLPSSKVKLSRRNGDSCNPVVMLKLNDSSRKSRVKTKQNDPIYEEEFSYLCKPPIDTSTSSNQRGRRSFSLNSKGGSKWPILQIIVEDDDKETVNEKLGEVSISLAPVPPTPSRDRSKSRDKSYTGKGVRGGGKEMDDDDWVSKLHSGVMVRKWFKLENQANKSSFGLGRLLGKTPPQSRQGKGKGGKGGKGSKGGKGKASVEPEVLLELEWTYNEDLIDTQDTSKEEGIDPLQALSNAEKTQEVIYATLVDIGCCWLLLCCCIFFFFF